MQSPPAFVLVRPQLAENVGTAVRALWNCGIQGVRLVAPRDWPHDKAIKSAAGAANQLQHVQVFETLDAAIEDLQIVLAATVRPRDLETPVYTLEESLQLLLNHQGQRTGILFGTERSGLTSDDVSLCSGILTIPLNPSYNSLNLAQAVLLVAHGWMTLTQRPALSLPLSQKEPLVSYKDFQGFLEHLERALDHSGFLYPPDLRPHMLRNLRALFARTHLTAQEVRTLRGVLSSFERLQKVSR